MSTQEDFEKWVNTPFIRAMFVGIDKDALAAAYEQGRLDERASVRDLVPDPRQTYCWDCKKAPRTACIDTCNFKRIPDSKLARMAEVHNIPHPWPSHIEAAGKEKHD